MLKSATLALRRYTHFWKVRLIVWVFCSVILPFCWIVTGDRWKRLRSIGGKYYSWQMENTNDSTTRFWQATSRLNHLYYYCDLLDCSNDVLPCWMKCWLLLIMSLCLCIECMIQSYRELPSVHVSNACKWIDDMFLLVYWCRASLYM